MTDFCPCGSKLPYPKCCGRFHSGRLTASTAEELMRSRYSAFCLQLPDYLFTTLHPTRRKPDELANLQRAVTQGNWTGLEIVSKRQGEIGDEQGYVAFRAHHEEQEQASVLEENSRFVKEKGTWFYVDGEFAPEKPPGRNEPCWCGSGKKYKKCHG